MEFSCPSKGLAGVGVIVGVGIATVGSITLGGTNVGTGVSVGSGVGVGVEVGGTGVGDTSGVGLTGAGEGVVWLLQAVITIKNTIIGIDSILTLYTHPCASNGRGQ